MVNEYGLVPTIKNISVLEECICDNKSILIDGRELKEFEIMVLLIKMRDENRRLLDKKLNISMIGRKLCY